MRIRPSGPTLVSIVLLMLLPALAVLQYRWVGQVSGAERERMQRNLRIAAVQFRDAFDGEIVRAMLGLQVGPATARDGTSDRYSDRYDTWLNTATYPQIVANVYIVDAANEEADAVDRLRLRRWNAETHTFDEAEWPAALARWTDEFQDALTAFAAGGGSFDRRPMFRGDDSLIVAPLRSVGFQGGGFRRSSAIAPVFGFTVLQLNMEYIRAEILPELALRHFIQSEGDVYRVAVTAFEDPGNVLYRSDPEAPVDPSRADAAVPLFGRTDFAFFFGRQGRAAGPGRQRGIVTSRRVDDDLVGIADSRVTGDSGRWRLLVQHQRGSLEAAVAGVRRRNLGISFGVLLLLTVSVGLLTATSRRAQRLAQQQMEFVAGVSHELRTPLTVIRSAAENLSQGVVGGDRVKRYGQAIDAEARRLGEMVERVLQYAGIESGLGFQSRAPVAPADIIEGAIESAVPALGGEDVAVERDIAADLPPVIGDADALRSAVHNLIANALKYGGDDRWVGVRAEQVRERRRSEVRITISDHGAGIPAAEIPHVFEPFYRGADAIARQVHGNGLGLSLVKRIVTAHGGRVSVTSRSGTGTSFTITLPAAEADPQPADVTNEVRAAAH